jgi:predicted acylesterase/phospholipase RssA/CRP-like cAMP-binding protein
MPFFDGLDERALTDVYGRMRSRRFAARTFICRQGEPGDSLFVIQEGVAQVIVEHPGQPRLLARLRRGDVVGEMSMVTGEARSASVIATVPTQALELDREGFAALFARHPSLLVNLSRILSRRLAQTSSEADRRRGEAVALLTGFGAARLIPEVIEAARAASPRDVTVLNFGTSTPSTGLTVARALEVLDDLLASHATVVLAGRLESDSLPLLVDNVDRIVLLLTPEEAVAAFATLAALRDRPEIVLVAAGARGSFPALEGIRLDGGVDMSSPARGVARLCRLLTRTRIGLALGAGGAKGYAHVGALYVLEEAGYTVDCVAGSSIGALVGAWLALGKTAPEIEATMRSVFSAENVAQVFTLTFSGASSALDVHRRVCLETTNGVSFRDLAIPFVAMAVDLNTRKPVPIGEGPVWEAMVASTALAGLFPPHPRDGQRLVDGLALVPVPTSSLVEVGADITVSVNLMSRQTLPAWPTGAGAAPSGARRGVSTLETILEVMDLAQLDASVRHAALADVVITPRFGPSTWRDFHLADLFLAAGGEAAREQLASLRRLARPMGS